MPLCTGGLTILISRVVVLSFLIFITMFSSTVLYSHGQQITVAQTNSAVSPTPSPTVSPTASVNQTGGSGADPTLIGAALIGIIAVGLMVGIYLTTRRM